MLLRNLNHQVAPGLRYHETPALCRTAFDGTRHPAFTPRAAVNHYTILNDLLEQKFNAEPGLLASFLAALGINREEWGGDQRSPYHLLTSDERGVLDTAFIDQSGEAMKTVIGQEEGPEWDLSMSDGLAWVVDAAVFRAVQREVARFGDSGTDILRESFRGGATKDLQQVLEDQGERYPLTQGLSRVFALHTDRIAPAAFRATILTKADLILHVLQNAKDDGAPGWHGFNLVANPDVFRRRLVRGGVELLRAYVQHREVMATDPASADVLAFLAAVRPDHAAAVFEQVVESVLGFYSEPDRFAELVLDEELSDSYGHPVLHEIECGPRVRLRIAPMRGSWDNYRSRHAVQHRDLVVGIIVRSILGADPSLDDCIVQAEATHVIHYFLTAPFVAANHVGLPGYNDTLRTTPGVQHLMAWSIR